MVFSLNVCEHASLVPLFVASACVRINISEQMR